MGVVDSFQQELLQNLTGYESLIGLSVSLLTGEGSEEKTTGCCVISRDAAPAEKVTAPPVATPEPHPQSAYHPSRGHYGTYGSNSVQGGYPNQSGYGGQSGYGSGYGGYNGGYGGYNDGYNARYGGQSGYGG